MLKYSTILLISFLFTSIAGCKSNDKPFTAATEITRSTETSIPGNFTPLAPENTTISRTQAVTDTPISITTIVPEITVTKLLETKVKTMCPEYLQNSSSDDFVGLSGKIVLEGGGHHIFVDFPSNRQSESADEQSVFPLKVSPDRSKYVFQDNKTRKITIKSLDGRILNSYKMGENWLDISDWVNDETILILLKNGDYPNYTYPLPLLALNVVTGDSRVLSPEKYPSIDNTNSLSWGYSSNTVYDPSVTKVVYPGRLKSAGTMGYIVWDTIKGKKIAEVSNDTYTNIPIWSPNGKMVAMPDQNGNLLLITSEGALSRTIKFSDLVRIDETGKKVDYYLPKYYSWSPDNRHIAIWLTTNGVGYDSLVILNSETGEMIDLCLTQNDDAINYGYSQNQPIWSPDGKSIAVTTNFRNAVQSWDVVIINLENSKVYKIASDQVSPIGWLSSNR